MFEKHAVSLISSVNFTFCIKLVNVNTVHLESGFYENIWEICKKF